MSSRPNPHSPSPSNLSHTLTSTHTHHQHISPHRHLPHCIQAGSGNPTAQKNLHYTLLLEKTTDLSLFSIRYHYLFHRTTNCTQTSQVSGVAIQLRRRYSQSLKLYELQKLIRNHQSSFCWIYLLLMTLSIIRSSCPPSHHWTSQGFHFAGLNPISLVGLSRWPGEVSRAHQLVTGVPLGSLLASQAA